MRYGKLCIVRMPKEASRKQDFETHVVHELSALAPLQPHGNEAADRFDEQHVYEGKIAALGVASSYVVILIMQSDVRSYEQSGSTFDRDSGCTYA